MPVSDDRPMSTVAPSPRRTHDPRRDLAVRIDGCKITPNDCALTSEAQQESQHHKVFSYAFSAFAAKPSRI
jgi:hypothetical protein